MNPSALVVFSCSQGTCIKSILQVLDTGMKRVLKVLLPVKLDCLKLSVLDITKMHEQNVSEKLPVKRATPISPVGTTRQGDTGVSIV